MSYRYILIDPAARTVTEHFTDDPDGCFDAMFEHGLYVFVREDREGLLCEHDDEAVDFGGPSFRYCGEVIFGKAVLLTASEAGSASTFSGCELSALDVLEDVTFLNARSVAEQG